MVFQRNINYVLTIHFPRNSPITGYANCEITFMLPFQSVEIQPCDIHLISALNDIKSVQYCYQPWRQLR